MLLKIVGDFLSNDESLGGDTRLTIIQGASLNCSLHGIAKVCARHNDKWITSAKFEDCFLHALRSSRAHFDPRFFTASQRSGSNSWIIQDSVHSARADQQGLKCTLGEAGAEQDLLDLQG